MNSDPAQHELLRLVGYACDGAIDDDQRTRLNELLASGAAMRAHYLRYISLHSALTTTAGNQAGGRLEELCDRLADAPETHAWQISRSAQPLLCSTLLRAAVVLLMVVPSAIYFSHWVASHGDTAPESTAPPIITVAGDDHRAGEQTVAPPQVITQGNARISRIAAGTRWPHPNESYTIDSIMHPGGRLCFAEGDIELVYESGVKLLLMGPAEFVLQDSGGKLVRGGLMASVPATGHGFTVETPHGKVVDLGTEFGVMVDDFGVSEVSVFEGKVDAFPSSTVAPKAAKFA